MSSSVSGSSLTARRPVGVLGPLRLISYELGAREGDHEHRNAVRLRHELFDEVEQLGLRPVDVVQDEDDGRLARERREEPLEGPRRFAGRDRLVELTGEGAEDTRRLVPASSMPSSSSSSDRSRVACRRTSTSGR